MSKAQELLKFLEDHNLATQALLEEGIIDTEENRDRISRQDMMNDYDVLKVERIQYKESSSSGSDLKQHQVFEFRFLDRKTPVFVKIYYWEYSYGERSIDKINIVKQVPIQTFKYEVVL